MKGQQMGVAGQDGDVLDTEQREETETIEGEPQDGATDEGEGTEGSEGADEGGGEGHDDEGGEDVVSIGSEEPPASEEDTKTAPQWVRDLRQRQRELAKENAELKAKLGTGQPGAAQKPTLPPKPKLADHDYDEEKYEQARDAWDAKKREIDAWEANQQAAADAQKKAQQAVEEHYATTKKGLKVSDFQEAEDEVAAALNPVQQALIKAGASNPALVVYALGRNPKKLSELASNKDPVKFAVALGKLETEVKVTKRTSTKPAPESTVRSGGSTSGTKATLERLQAEADRTGDRTKVAAYLRQQKQAGKK